MSNIYPPYRTLQSSEIDRPDVSVVIRCKNEAAFIGTCLDKILEQKTKRRMEIIIIDSGSTDGTVDIARRYPVSVIVIEPAEFNFGTSMNLGIHLARAEFCVFLSAHAIPYDSVWLEQLVDATASDDRVAGAYSRQLPRSATCLIERRQLAEKFGPTSRRQSLEGYADGVDKRPDNFLELRPFMTFSNASSCVRRSVATVQPFKPLTGSEDREWAMNVVRQGYAVVYQPSSRIYHAHNETVRAWYKRIFINAQALRAFTGFQLNPMWAAPVTGVNVVKDLVHLVSESRRHHWGAWRTLAALCSAIPTSLIYWTAYTVAFYRGSHT